MGCYENIMEENRQRGIVPNLEAMHFSRAICEDCGEEIKIPSSGYSYEERESYTGRWLSDAEAEAWGLDATKPVFSHVVCPEAEEW